jgi:quercetin dioxygenase-like cupin family protein
MKRLWKRTTRLAVLTLGFGGLFVAASAVPGTATPSDPSGSFRSTIQARGTNTTPGTIPISQGLDIVVARNDVDPGGTSGWHSHPGGAIVVIAQGEITFFRWIGNHCTSTRYTAGQSFIEHASEVGNAKNTGSTLTVVFATFPGVPVGVIGAQRIDVSPGPPPGTCRGL